MPKAERAVTLDERGLRVDGVVTPLVAGSIEYWRLISLFWGRSLKAIKSAGLDQVSSFVCWDFHELADGGFDFTGETHPSRDLVGFIDQCAAEGFDFLLRVGPIIDAEWPTRGPAEDVCRLERSDPRYRERTEEFLGALLPHIVPRLATNGGPIILVSVDNEPYFPYSTDAESDPSEGSIHVPYAGEAVRARYGDWLRERYGDDAGLRAAWGDHGGALDAIAEPDYRTHSTRAVLDSFEFITDTIAETYTWMRDFSRAQGVDVPIYSNMKQFSHYIDWSQIEDVVDSHGLGMFLTDMVPGDQALVASWYVRLERAVTRFPWAAEFQSLSPMGQEEVFGAPSDDHQRYLTELALALGLRGLSYYVFVERDDVQGAPISPLGKVRPRLEQVKQAITMAKALQADQQLADVGLLWSLDHHRLAIAERFDDWRKLYHIWIDMDRPKELGEWWEAFRELHAEDIDFAIVPMSRAATEPIPRVLVYAGPDSVRPSDLEPVVEAVEAGSTLLARSLPTTAISGTDSELAALTRRLEQTGRLTLLDETGLLAALAELELQTPIQADTDDVWTTAYETDDAYTFFVANVGTQPRRPDIRLSPQLAERIAARTARDLVTGETWTTNGNGLFATPASLDPKHVTAITIAKEEVSG